MRQDSNFFFNLRVSTPDGKQSTPLTNDLIRCVSKVDIQEAIASEDSDGANSVTITFVESDYLPDTKVKSPREGVLGNGLVTNRTGQLIDLRFDSEKGFTFVTKDELESGLTQSSRTKSKKQEPVRFLFQAGNIITVTWGLVAPLKSRTRTFKIGSCNYTTNTAGGQLVVQGYDLSSEIAKYKLSEGKSFTTPSGNPESLKQVLYRLATTFGARLIFDKVAVTSYPSSGPDRYINNRTQEGGDTLPADPIYPITLIRQNDLHSQVRELAQNYSSAYEIYDDPILGVPVIEFTSLSLRFPKPVRSFTYRDNSGTVLEVQYNSIEGLIDQSSNSSSIGEQGQAEAETITVELTDAGVRDQVYIFRPDDTNFQEQAKKQLNRSLVGRSETTPSTEQAVIEQNNDNQTRAAGFTGFLTLKVIGDPEYKPDLYQINGIGARASTTYRMFQVTHSLSTSGYTCAMSGKTQTVGDGGVANTDALKDNTEYEVRRLSTGRN